MSNKRSSASELNSARLVNLAWIIIGAIIIGGLAWWLSTIEKTWEAQRNPSDAFRKNPMVAATRLLEKRQYQVQSSPILTEDLLKQAPKGTLIIANNEGHMSIQQAKALFAWVGEGNTLITFPKLSISKATKTEKKSDGETSSELDQEEDVKNPEESDQDDEYENGQNEEAKRVATPLLRDPIGEYLGIASTYDERTGVKYYHSSLLRVPSLPYALKLRKPSFSLHTKSEAHTPLFTDEHGDVIRVYAYGKGHIAALSENIFELQALQHYDHAEILLGLIRLNPKHQGVTIVQRLKIPAWYELLWNAFPLALCLFAVAIMLLFWRTVTRFGPLLPETNWERRSLIEHIEASGRWAWSSAVGRDLLLTAARLSTKHVLQKRAPELQKMSVDEQLVHLAKICQLDHEHLTHAWHDAASSNPHLFTRQIQQLQQLRAHYEH